MAVRSRPSFYQELADATEGDGSPPPPPPPFWIAKITGLDRDANELVLTYYRRSARNAAFFNYAPETSGSINVSAVLAYGFTLTSNRKVRQVTYRAIARVLELQAD